MPVSMQFESGAVAEVLSTEEVEAWLSKHAREELEQGAAWLEEQVKEEATGRQKAFSDAGFFAAKRLEAALESLPLLEEEVELVEKATKAVEKKAWASALEEYKELAFWLEEKRSVWALSAQQAVKLAEAATGKVEVEEASGFLGFDPDYAPSCQEVEEAFRYGLAVQLLPSGELEAFEPEEAEALKYEEL